MSPYLQPNPSEASSRSGISSQRRDTSSSSPRVHDTQQPDRQEGLPSRDPLRPLLQPVNRHQSRRITRSISATEGLAQHIPRTVITRRCSGTTASGRRSRSDGELNLMLGRRRGQVLVRLYHSHHVHLRRLRHHHMPPAKRAAYRYTLARQAACPAYLLARQSRGDVITSSPF
jgi:hypothetical protein